MNPPRPISLRRHPVAAAAWVSSLRVELRALPAASLSLSFILEGDLSRARVPSPLTPQRVDGLWRHTCFEVFVGARDRGDYLEYNLAPSGQWQAYYFSDYRQNRRLLGAEAPSIGCTVTGRELSFRATILLPEATDPGSLRLAPCAVLEDTHGELSYWALRHLRPAPDFHDPAAYVSLSALLGRR